MLLQGTAEEGRAEEKHLLQRAWWRKTQVPLEEVLCLQHCSSSQLATDSLDQAGMYKYCHEGSSRITAGRQNIKGKNQPKKKSKKKKKSTEANNGPRGHKSIVYQASW